MKKSMRGLLGLLTNVNKSARKETKHAASKKGHKHIHNLSYGQRKRLAFLEAKNV